MDNLEKFFEKVYRLSKLKEEQSFSFISAIIDCVRHNSEVHDYDFIYRFCIDRINSEKTRPINGKKVSDSYFEGNSFWDFDKKCIGYLKATHEKGHSMSGDKLSDEEYKEACLFLKLYVVLVCEEALSKGEDEKITIEGKPFKPRFTIDQVKSMIDNFIQSKLGI